LTIESGEVVLRQEETLPHVTRCDLGGEAR